MLWTFFQYLCHYENFFQYLCCEHFFDTYVVMKIISILMSLPNFIISYLHNFNLEWNLWIMYWNLNAHKTFETHTPISGIPLVTDMKWIAKNQILELIMLWLWAKNNFAGRMPERQSPNELNVMKSLFSRPSLLGPAHPLKALCLTAVFVACSLCLHVSAGPELETPYWLCL